MTFSQSHQRWIGGPANSPMYVGSAQAIPEPEAAPEPSRVPVESQANVGLLLQAILDELRRINTTPREGAVSSVEIKFLANGTPQPCVKAYGDSPVPVEAAIEAYGAAFRAAEAGQMAKWAATVEALRA